MSRESDLGWAAGIVDGEGYIGLLPSGRRRRASGRIRRTTWELRLCVCNTDILMLRKLFALFGGAVRFRRKGTDRHKPQWIWEVTAARAAKTMVIIQPYLVTKAEQARVALLSRQHLGRRSSLDPNGEALAWLARRLKELKHEIPEVEHAQKEEGQAGRMAYQEDLYRGLA